MTDYTKAIIVFKQNNDSFAGVNLPNSEVLKQKQAATLAQIEKNSAQKLFFYSDYIEREDVMEYDNWIKMAQFGTSLADKIKDAFQITKSGDYKQMVFVQALTENLSNQLIEQAFEKLKIHDVVIGSDKTNNCYLVGLNHYNLEFFENKDWSKAPKSADFELEADKLGFSLAKLDATLTFA